MPSLSPPPTTRSRQPSSRHSSSLSTPQLAPPLATKVSASSLKAESDADARLRDRSPASKGPGEAFGGRRRAGAGGKDVVGKLGKREYIVLGVVCAVGWGVRMYKLGWPTSVVFDEVHFGGFASKYIRQRFFMDVHPPLAKLLITLMAYIGGFDGEFDFKDIGKDYLEPRVPYVLMRSLPALLGLALIPLTFLTLISLRLSLPSAILGSLLITFDNALITQSRLILLDSFLVFFTALTTFFWVRFSAYDSEGYAFTPIWWRYLTLAGASLGAVASVKWVGLFTIAVLGLGTLRQLWLLLGNQKVTPRMWVKHFAARALCLIVLPSMVYMFMFQIHFWVLSGSGDGDGFMSSEFQHTLRGHGMEDTYADVSYGSIVSIKHVHTQGGYLHSHAHPYPGGSQQQQITLYPHRDDNNLWRITNMSAPDAPAQYPWDDLPLDWILTGSKIRLEHKTTGKRLHSHDVRPPVSDVEFQNEVSGYGFDGFPGDANDDFVVEIAPKTRGKRDKQAKHRLRTLRSEFRLRHALTGCYLFSHKVKLPEWGFEQQEVTCNKNPTWDNSLWYIETNTHAQLPFDAEKLNYQRPSFFQKFWELQAVMWRTNAGLTDRHAYDSRPQHWPVLRRGINFWVKENRQVYLLGNPVVWFSSTIAVVTYLLLRGVFVLREKRGYRDLQQPKIAFYDSVLSFLVISWALHYLPFFLMSRQLFLHHYLPALWFAVLAFSAVFDFATSALRPRTRLQIAMVMVILVIAAWQHFSPLSYAGKWTRGQCEKSKWLKNWDFSCNDFHENLGMYKDTPVVPSSKIIESIANQGEFTTTMVDEAPEPIKNAFDDPNAPPEEKTIAPVGPINEVQMQQSTDGAPPPLLAQGQEAPKAEDTRAPVGVDAGNPEVTAGGNDHGGWQGGAEEGGGREQGRGEEEKEREMVRDGLEKVKAGQVEMGLDDEARRLADEAMRADEEVLE